MARHTNIFLMEFTKRSPYPCFHKLIIEHEYFIHNKIHGNFKLINYKVIVKIKYLKQRAGS